MSDTIRLSGVTVNAPDALDLARFYAVITGGVAKGNSHWATVTGPNGASPSSRFKTSARRCGRSVRYRCSCTSTSSSTISPPPGRGSSPPGATRFDFEPNDDHCFVYADPVGHPFCRAGPRGPRHAG